jgi:hypothetical protein
MRPRRRELRAAAPVELQADRQKDCPMPQMFDWIFFAIMLPFPAFLVWDWMQHR